MDIELGLFKVLSYHPETGLLFWTADASKAVKNKPAGTIHPTGYINVMYKGKYYKAHRLAWLLTYRAYPKNMIDHINGIRSDNRIENLRDVTNTINQHNQKTAHTNSKSGLIGASWNVKNKAWKSQIKHQGNVIYLGLHETAKLAHEAYLIAKRKIHIGCTI